MTARGGVVLGIDVGGTKIAAGLVSLEGKIGERSECPTPAGGPDILLAAHRLGEGLVRRGAAAGRVLGVGIGVAELVDLAGNVASANRIDWRGLAVRDRFAPIGPAVVEADVRAAALAEAVWGAGRSHRVFLFVTVGTGISCSLVQERRPYTGARGFAGTFASGPVDPVEAVASGPALVARFVAAGGSAKRAEEVLAAAADGDRRAAEVAVSGGAALGRSVGWLINTLDPETVVVGGGLGSASGPYWDAFLEVVRKSVWAEAHRGVPIVHAQYGADAGLAGAAAAFLSRSDAGQGR